MLKNIIRSIAIITLFVAIACKPTTNSQQSALQNQQPIKNIILMIGDGMGPQQVGQVIQYRQLVHPDQPALAFEQFLKSKHKGLVETHSANSLATDSAAAATAMACGFKTYNEMMAIDPQGKKCFSILKTAKDLGKLTGLVSNTRMSHATVAPFVSHHVSRLKENDIAMQIISESEVDLILNGGARHLLPKKSKFSDLSECQGIDPTIDGHGKRKDDKNLIEVAKEHGYRFVCKTDQLANLDLKKPSKILGLFTNSTFPHIQERQIISTIPSLPHMTKTAIDYLSQNQNGFFLMVESGLIDYAGHENDAATQLKETLEFDSAIKVAQEFVKKHPDTLLIVTADHETGGFGISYRQAYENELESIEIPGAGIYKTKYKPVPLKTTFELIENQTASLTGILDPILDKLYADGKKDPTYTLDMASNELITRLNKHTAYKIDQDQSKYVLSRETGHDRHHHDTLYPFCTAVDAVVNANKLGRLLSPQNHHVWATGNHTAVPVHIFAEGPDQIASLFAGQIDNTDIYKIMKKAFSSP